MAWNKPKFFWEHGLTALVADLTATGDYAATNLAVMREDTFWKSSGIATQYIRNDAGVGLSINGDFETGVESPWLLSVGGSAAATSSITTGAQYQGIYYLVVVVTSPGNLTDISYSQSSITVEKGVIYTIIFAARASADKSVDLTLVDSQSPNVNLGLDETISLTSSWQIFSYTFTATATDADARINFYVGGNVNDFYLDAVSLHESGKINHDFLGIAGHNLATVAATVSLEYSHSGSGGWADLLAEFVPGNNKAFVKEFTKVAARYTRLKLAGMTAVPQAAITIWGQKTTLDFASVSYDPHGQKIHANVNESQAGYIAGIHEKWRERNIRLQINNVPAFGTIDPDLKRWFDDHGMQLFFLGWETGEHDTEIWLVRNKDGGRNWPLTSGGLYRSISFNLTGRVET